VSDTTGTTAAVTTTTAATMERHRYQGVVKTVLTEKRYGFIRVVNDDQDSSNNNRQSDVFFSFRNLPAGRIVQKGDAVSFRKEMDRRNSDKAFAADIQFEKAVDASDVDGSFTTTTTISLPAFSMGMPFAALLTNGCKTIETRNNRMLADHCPAGTKVLIHVGRRDFDDGGRHRTILQRTGRSDAAIRQLMTLPPPAARGMIVAICEVGMTSELSLQQRSEPVVEEQIVAFGADSGYMASEIRRVAYLKRPVPCRGQGGIFTVDIDPAILPDGWTTLTTTTPTTNDARQNSRDDGRPPRDGTRLVYSITG
jgi:cold shock CspA family protein